MKKTLLTTLMAILQLVLLAQNAHRYTSFSEALGEPEKVVWLDLKCMDLDDFERHIQKLPNVKVLFLVDCGFKTLPLGIEHLKNIELLKVQGNNLTTLPKK